MPDPACSRQPSDAEPNAEWESWIAGLRAGDPVVSQAVFDRYGEVLQRMAARRMPPKLRRRIDPDDIAQSALRTFFRRASAGQFQLDDFEGLWQLLCAITLTKVREQARFQLRQKRGLQREEEPAVRDDQSSSGPQPVAAAPTPVEAAEFADQFEQLFGKLDEEEQQVLLLKLQDLTHDEVAAEMGSSERTVRRIIKRIQGRLTQLAE
jgi:RNA polymerase sigma-70 factor (ECF subfamily)